MGGGRDNEDPARRRPAYGVQSGCRAAIDPEKVLASLIDHAPLGLAVVDAYEVRFLSERGRALLGDAAGSLGVLAMPAARALRGETIDREEWVHRPRSGGETTFVCSGWPIVEDDGSIPCAVLSFDEAHDPRPVHEAHLRAQRLESLGLLASGIAHDFNNILTSIFGNIEIAKMHAQRPDAAEALSLAEKAFDQARDLAGQLLAFARGGTSLPRTMHVGTLLADTVRFSLHGSNVRPEFHIDADLWPAKIDEARIGHAIQNLVINAKQAMLDGGALRVEAKNVILAEDNAERLPAGRYLRVAFEDEGVGIDGGDLPFVFEPYFTRRAGGTGLGLASTRSIVRAHDGEVTVDSALAEGATFTILLPASDEPEAPRRVSEVVRVAAKGTILLMDDDESVRRVGAALLARLGFESKVARDGAEAVALYREALEAGRPFVAVILDLTVPGAMGGTECLRELRAIDAGVRALVSSGYASDLVMSAHEEYGFCAVVPKPYRLADLSNALALALPLE